MKTETPAAPGYLSALGSLVDGLLATVQSRFELFTVELQEEKYRLIQTFIWICAVIFTAMLAITFASLTLVYIFWESARLTVLGGLAVFYALALLVLIIGYRRFVARQPKPFTATRQEISEDRTCIRNES